MEPGILLSGEMYSKAFSVEWSRGKGTKETQNGEIRKGLREGTKVKQGYNSLQPFVMAKWMQHLWITRLLAMASQRQDHYGKKLIDLKCQAWTHLPCRNCTIRSPHKGPLKEPTYVAIRDPSNQDYLIGKITVARDRSETFALSFLFPTCQKRKRGKMRF